MGEIATEPPPHSVTKLNSPSRWPAWYALFTAWILPSTTARRTQHVSLYRAFGVHLIAAVPATMLVVFLVSWADSVSEIGPAMVMFRLLGYLVAMWMRHPVAFTMGIIGIGIAIEMGFIALASLIVAWGARVEPLRASYAHALRRTWLQTGHVLPVILLAGLMAIHFEHARRDWFRQNRYPFIPYSPPPPPTEPATAQAEADYNQSVHEYSQEHNKQRQLARDQYDARQPWSVRYGVIFPLAASFIFGAWIIWALLRSVGTSRDTPPQFVPPPLCEFCGYNLTDANMEGRCPECGKLVIESFGAHVRPGTSWQQHYRSHRLHGYWCSCLDAILRPDKFGRQIRLFSPGNEHRRFIAWHLIPLFFISAAGFLVVVIADSGIYAIHREPEILWIGAPSIGFLTAICALAVVLLDAGIIGVLLTYQFGRNLLPATMQIASYLTGFLTLCIAFAWVSGALFMPAYDWSRHLQQLWRVHHEMIRLLAWAGLNLIWVAFYVFRLWQGASAGGYANR